jgi:hypothetical protein
MQIKLTKPKKQLPQTVPMVWQSHKTFYVYSPKCKDQKNRTENKIPILGDTLLKQRASYKAGKTKKIFKKQQKIQ